MFGFSVNLNHAEKTQLKRKTRGGNFGACNIEERSLRNVHMAVLYRRLNEISTREAKG